MPRRRRPHGELPSSAGLSRAARVGVWLFLVYLALYLGFMALTVIDPDSLARRAGPANLAIMYGFFLIVAALALAFVYMRLCRDDDADHGSAP